MNLWVRTSRQLAVWAVALFFFSCEDETSLLGFKNPNEKFHVGYVEIPLNVSSVVAIDSMVTDLRSILDPNGQARTVDGLIVGQYQDPQVGSITAQSFISIFPTVNSALQTSAVYDSVTVQFRLNGYGYGFTGLQQKTFKIHELTGDTLTLFNGNTYYASSPAPQYSAEPLGEATVSVHYDSLLKQAAIVPSQQDTLLVTGRLADDFGARLFEAIRAGFASSAAYDVFKSNIKGLAVLPGEEPGVLGLTVTGNAGQFSRVVLHYHTLTDAGAVDDTLSRTFGTELASFSKIEADRSGTELAGILLYQGIQPPSDLRYVQSGAALITKVDLAPFYAFADTVNNILINSAELVIEDVSPPLGYEPHSAMMLRLMNSTNDQFLNNRITADVDKARPYYVLTSPSERYYFAASDEASPVPAPASIIYDDETNRFSGFITVFAQSLFMNKSQDDGSVNQDRLTHFALFPVSPPASRSVTRTIFSKENVKLRLFYTRANPVTP